MKYLILFALLMITSSFHSAPKPEIIYVGDPMCSWCYGFSDNLEAFKKKYESQYTFKLITGGLRINQTEKIDAAMKRFLTHHWKQVNKASDKPFKYEILERTDFIYDTEMACRAVVAARKLQPENAYSFFFKLQSAFYAENIDITQAENCVKIAVKAGFNENTFHNELKNNKAEVYSDFQTAQQMGATGFPTVLLLKDGKYYKLTEGFCSLESLEEALHKFQK